jgi:uncharacterized protein (DUF4415 family)
MTSKHKPRPTRADKENPNWTAKEFAAAKRVEDIPALAHLTKRKPGERGPQKAPTKEAVKLRLDPDVLAHYRGTGPGWQTRINDDLRRTAKLRAKAF